MSDANNPSSELLAELNSVASAAAATVGDTSTLDELGPVASGLLGKKSTLTVMKSKLGSLEPERRREFGQALNAARAEVEALIEARRAALKAEARAIQIEAERLDLTELRDELKRGHYHLVTQARDRLEDVFVGMGFTIAEGPEVETAWY
ncbi:MAG: phenylalanine--tRNA ligase subunit alpha, partial [Acidimicrobiales bacterium]